MSLGVNTWQDTSTRRNRAIPEVYIVTTEAWAGQQGPAWIRWLERSAQAHTTAVVPRTVRAFLPWIVMEIDGETDGETATTTHVAMTVTLMAHL